MTKRVPARRPLFQRRHYQKLADAIVAAKRRPSDSVDEAIADLERDLADFFASDNPPDDRGRGFNRSTFERACSGETNGHRFTEDNR